MLRKAFDFLIFTSLFIAVCAVLMAYQTAILFNLTLPFGLMGFVFWGSVCSYNFHWFLTPPNLPNPSYKLNWNICNRNIHLALFILGLIASGIFCFLLLPYWFWLGVTAFLTFLYSAPKISFPFFTQLRKVAVGKTIFLAFAWAHVTTLLPLVITVKQLNAPEIWFVINRFFFIFPICIVFDRRDVEEDKKAGIKSLITFLNDRGIDILFWLTIIIYTVSCIALLQSFAILTIAILFFPVIILCLLYYPSKHSLSDYLYYFVLDGLMMLSSPLLILIKFAGINFQHG